MSTLRPANLWIHGIDAGREWPMGKVVQYRGEWIVHAHSKLVYMHDNSNSWGVRSPFIKFMIDYRISRVFLWVREQSLTYVCNVDQLHRYGTHGVRDPFGGTINLHLDYWTQFEGQLCRSYPPDSQMRYLDPVDDPWDRPWMNSTTSQGHGEPRYKRGSRSRVKNTPVLKPKSALVQQALL